MTINTEGLALLKNFEGFAEVRDDPNVAWAYWDNIGKVWTGPWGFTDGVKDGDHWTRSEADALLIQLLVPYEQAVRDACTIEPNENQFAALVVCAWNIGKAGIAKSSMIKAHNRADFQSAARSFGLWNKAGGKAIAGLTRRRAAEAALYLKPVSVHGAAPVALPMPQQVDPESSLARSPIIATSTIAGTTATIGSVAQASRDFKDIREGLGEWLWIAIAVGAIVVTGITVYYRWKQRKLGFV